MAHDAAPRVGFLGAGKMATALARGWLQAGLIARQTMAGDPSEQARKSFWSETGLAVSADNREVVSACDLLLIAVKPQSLPVLMQEIQPALQPRHLIVSIAAGISLRQLAEGLG